MERRFIYRPSSWGVPVLVGNQEGRREQSGSYQFCEEQEIRQEAYETVNIFILQFGVRAPANRVAYGRRSYTHGEEGQA